MGGAWPTAGDALATTPLASEHDGTPPAFALEVAEHDEGEAALIAKVSHLLRY